jgi:hypothetical protein
MALFLLPKRRAIVVAVLAFTCVGFTPIQPGISVNCVNCKRYELYEEIAGFKATDWMMRGNRGIRVE